MQEITLYKIKNVQEHNILGYARDLDTAKKIAKSRGFWGSDATILSETIKIFDSIEDFIKNR